MKLGLTYIPESHRINDVIETRLSFRPFITYLQKHISTSNETKASFYRHILNEFYKDPVCSSNISIEDVGKHAKLLELIYTVLSPLTADEKDHYWAMAAPASKNVFYGTEAYIQLVNSVNSSELDSKYIFEQKEQFRNRLIKVIYLIILEKYYGITSLNSEKMVYSNLNAQTGLTRYFRLDPDTHFVEVMNKTNLPALDFEHLDRYIENGQVTEELKQLLPLSDFYLEGFTVITLEDVTDDYAIEIIKKTLIEHSGNQELLYDRFKYGLKILGGNKDIEFGMLPFLSVNNKFVFDDVDCSRSVLIRAARKSKKSMESIYSSAAKYITNPEKRIYPAITDEVLFNNPHLVPLRNLGIKSYSVIPVFYNQNIVGTLEVYSSEEVEHYEYILSRLEEAIPLVAQLLQNSIEQFKQKIDNIIKDKFTSLQSSVQWKFNEVALEYFRSSNMAGDEAAIGSVAFHDVYPLYGSIDIRNSTIERNMALSNDIDNLLDLLEAEMAHICALVSKEDAAKIESKFSAWYESIDVYLKLSDPGLLNLLLQSEVVPHLSGLLKNNPEAAAPITRLKSIIEKDDHEISGYRTRLETSIQAINSSLNSYLRQERKKLKAIFPCYFETFRTDGVEYDLYTGQSIKPDMSFTPEHLEAFRLWQLRSMCEVVHITNGLLGSTPRPLHTTQLIYVNPHAINISFRNDERHFDVDGAYNIRYQIVKKRIDKVHVKDTDERLTQPGKIAIVYFNNDDLAIYTRYIKLCQQEGLLYDGCEKLDLEELQGVTGLKALRVTVKV